MFGLLKRKEDHTAKINGNSDGVVLTVEHGRTLLNAALGSGINWPHKCKVGSCGTCKCQVVSGSIKPQIDFSYVLTQEEIDSGYVLACQSELKSDIAVEVKLRNTRKQDEES